ncbi:MAG: hypothetical protein JW904_06830 [Spirochaetales bacterium]|nr:hypothetical protein [Spirochaetales bacterium]
MANVVVLFGPQENSMKEYAKTIADAFKNKKYKVTVKPALNAEIPDVAPADIIIFGNKLNSPDAIHEDYREIVRASEGVNFSGRLVAVFTEHGSASGELFKSAMADTGATFFETSFRIKNNKLSGKELDEWAAAIDRFYKDFENARHV